MKQQLVRESDAARAYAWQDPASCYELQVTLQVTLKNRILL